MTIRCPEDNYYMLMILAPIEPKKFRLNGYRCPKCGLEILI